MLVSNTVGAEAGSNRNNGSRPAIILRQIPPSPSLYRRIVSIEHPGLFFAELVQPIGPTIPLVEVQAQLKEKTSPSGNVTGGRKLAHYVLVIRRRKRADPQGSFVARMRNHVEKRGSI